MSELRNQLLQAAKNSRGKVTDKVFKSISKHKTEQAASIKFGGKRPKTKKIVIDTKL